MDYQFSPNFKLSAININNIIEAFKERIEKYYFDPIKILNEGEFGFAATALLASLIDILAKTENHDMTNEKIGKKYTKWLEENLGFGSQLAKNFYNNFRCGLLHAGCVESGDQISYSQKELCVSINGGLIINPKLLLQNLETQFYYFIKDENPQDLFNYLEGKLSEIH